MCCPSNTPALAAADRCGAPPFADKDIAAVVSHGTFEAYLKIREKMREETLAEEMRAEMERRIALERERASAAGSAADSQIRVALAKEHIVESILTLACPRCKQAFVDFDGCFALQCGRCRAAFCAYCLADCGRDAHAHVGACEEGKASIKATKGSNRRVGGHPATVYGTRAMFDVSQKRRRCKHLALYLERFDDAQRKEVLTSVDRELKDLGIAPKDVERWRVKENKAIEDREAAARNQGARGRAGGGGGGGARGAMRAAMEAAAGAARGRGRRRGAQNALEMAAAMMGGFMGIPPPPGFEDDDENDDDLARAAADAGMNLGAFLGMGLAPGERPPGELGPLRRERRERREREAAERAARARENPPGELGPLRRERAERRAREEAARRAAAEAAGSSPIDLTGWGPGARAATATSPRAARNVRRRLDDQTREGAKEDAPLVDLT